MNKEFVWEVPANQTFDSSYGAQTVTCTDPVSFSKDFSAFRANAPGAPVVFMQAVPGGPVRWSRATIIIESSDVTFDFNNNVNALDCYSPSFDGPPFVKVSNSSLKMKNINDISLGTGIALSNNATFNVVGVGMVRMGFESNAGLSITDSHASFVLNRAFMVSGVSSDNGHFEIQTDICVVHTSMRVLNGSSGIFSCKSFHLSGEDGSEHIISENSSLTIQTGSVEIEGIFITLGEGNSRVSIERIPGQDPVDLTSLATSKKGFNFVGTKDTNTSELTLDFSYDGRYGNNGFGWSWLLDNKLIAVNGIPQHNNSILSYDVSSAGVMTIKFRTKA